MRDKAIAALAVLSIALSAPPALAQATSAADHGLEEGIRLVREGDFAGAVVTLVSAFIALVAAAMLMRATASAAHPSTGAAAAGAGPGAAGISERGMWDALDEGRDPTAADPADEGR